MKTGFACWEDRIAPVFDSARQIMLVESIEGKIVSESREALPDGQPFGMASFLHGLGIESLVCGAISRPLQKMIEDRGIKVVSFVAGNLREIIKACLSGSLLTEQFAMPGCCQRGRGRGGKMGRGLGQGRGRGLMEPDVSVMGRGQGLARGFRGGGGGGGGGMGNGAGPGNGQGRRGRGRYL